MTIMINNDNRMEIFQRQSELCKSLADTKRLMIVHELRNGEKSVGELAELLGLKQSNTSQHLAVLRNAGVILPRREGSTIFYSLSSPLIGDACDLVRAVIANQIERSRSLAGSI